MEISNKVKRTYIKKDKKDKKAEKELSENIKIENIKIENIKIEKQEIKYNNLIEVDRMEVLNLPDGIQVATMCSSCKIGTKLNLTNIEKYLTLNEDDILAIKKNNENFRSLIINKKKTKRIPKKDVNTNHFYNQLTILMRVTSGETQDINKEPIINIKLLISKYNFFNLNPINKRSI